MRTCHPAAARLQRMLPDAPSIRPHAGSVRTRADRKQVSVLVVNGGLSSAKLDSDMYLRTTPMEMRRRASLQRAKHYGMHCARRWTGNAVGAALCHVAGAFSQNWRA